MIKDFSFLPTRILFGLNTWERIGEVAREVGFSSLLVVTDESFSMVPVFQKVIDRISDARDQLQDL